ncbi:hypothetical protein BS47DRAFT_238506 [Hydnum rufescens UP504]|uniref:Uncharacterized protein n=1 Tax=Hydnum rufescens UP504 TaxID=1448309 RepID=A0A9P6AMC2_9AGAM|nr:hypothetical protein BS47DRAFT_238506 [Hydnum rufescens UP504]
MKRRTMYTTQRKSCIRPRSRANAVRQYDTLNGKMAITYHCRLSAIHYPRSARKPREDKRIAQIVVGKWEVLAHSVEYQREEDMARKQEVTQGRQYRELIDIAESHEGVLLFACCIFAATWSPRDTHNQGT